MLHKWHRQKLLMIWRLEWYYTVTEKKICIKNHLSHVQITKHSIDHNIQLLQINHMVQFFFFMEILYQQIFHRCPKITRKRHTHFYEVLLLKVINFRNLFWNFVFLPLIACKSEKLQYNFFLDYTSSNMTK